MCADATFFPMQGILCTKKKVTFQSILNFDDVLHQVLDQVISCPVSCSEWLYCRFQSILYSLFFAYAGLPLHADRALKDVATPKMSMQKGSNEPPKWTLDPALKNISFETPLDHFKSE